MDRKARALIGHEGMRWSHAGTRTRSQQATISDCPLSSTISPLVPPGHMSALLSGTAHRSPPPSPRLKRPDMQPAVRTCAAAGRPADGPGLRVTVAAIMVVARSRRQRGRNR